MRDFCGRSRWSVKAETVDLEVPANAEYILEGYVELGELRTEGPFVGASPYCNAMNWDTTTNTAAVNNGSACGFGAHDQYARVRASHRPRLQVRLHADRHQQRDRDDVRRGWHGRSPHASPGHDRKSDGRRATVWCGTRPPRPPSPPGTCSRRSSRTTTRSGARASARRRTTATARAKRSATSTERSASCSRWSTPTGSRRGTSGKQYPTNACTDQFVVGKAAQVFTCADRWQRDEALGRVPQRRLALRHGVPHADRLRRTTPPSASRRSLRSRPFRCAASVAPTDASTTCSSATGPRRTARSGTRSTRSRPRTTTDFAGAYNRIHQVETLMNGGSACQLVT